jgi:hypothetical protein
MPVMVSPLWKNGFLQCSSGGQVNLDGFASRLKEFLVLFDVLSNKIN